MSEIITAAITGCVTLLGVLLSNRAAQAVTDEKLTELTGRSGSTIISHGGCRWWRNRSGAWTAGWSNWNRGSGVSPSLEMADREEQEWIFQHLVWQAWRRSR